MKKHRRIIAPCRLAAATVLLLGACSSVVRLRNGLEWATLREGRYLAPPVGLLAPLLRRAVHGCVDAFTQ